MISAEVALLEKDEIIKKLDELIKPVWKAKLAKRADVHLNTVMRWADGGIQHSYAVEKAARQLIHEEKEIRKMFPGRATTGL